MADTRATILTALETELGTITDIKKSVLKTLPPSKAETNSPYIGIVAGDETLLVEDSTNIRWNLPVFLFLITEEQYTEVETLIKEIKNVIYNTGEDLTLTANVLDFNILEVQPVSLEDFDDERYSSVRIDMNIIYYTSQKNLILLLVSVGWFISGCSHVGSDPTKSGNNFCWTVPNDNSNDIKGYDVRYTLDSAGVWDSWNTVDGEPAALLIGETQCWSVPIPNGVWFVAVKASDNSDNWSAISNIVHTSYDTISPESINDLR